MVFHHPNRRQEATLTVSFRDLRYIRLKADNLPDMRRYAIDILGLQEAEASDETSYFRSDNRAYSLCLSNETEQDAIALTVADEDNLKQLGEQLSAAGFAATFLTADECQFRKVKAGITTVAPNGVIVEFVWRPLASGWRYHGSRDAGIVELNSIALACQDVAASEVFWTKVLGCAVSDWVGDTAYIRLDDAHHRIAIYPSDNNGILGIDFAVEDLNNVMQNFYFLQKHQQPIVHGPGKQAASDKIFVTTRGPRRMLFTFSTGMTRGEAVTGRIARQFAPAALSHCAWGSETDVPEFGDH